ncbi:tRNA1(Val) (adenine(37)-N6)-methyltransferase [Neptunicella sp. SCSIO 80796]|uniref:tRNA1(Val) (adenine(37)-N6)-methyltransferase n=1 Tax=Neptunicella plasticusilytica TaxID=3117012 RepID=UPI003A4D2068
MNKAAGFQFKQFFIEHSQVAMKVGTDSIILGSWLNVYQTEKILDVGTGSGLLAIMLAQKSDQNCQIVGIDIEADAIRQAASNAENSPWSNKLSFVHQPFQSCQTCGWDLIVSNPPYFPAGQRFGSSRQIARHNQHLGYAELLRHSASLLNRNGRFACIIPHQFVPDVVAYARDYGLLLGKQLVIRASDSKSPIRSVLQFSAQADQTVVEELSIHSPQGDYSMAYKRLCKDYYLNF